MILGLAGFSFAGIVAITVISNEKELQRLETSMFFLMVSFLAYFFALSIQGYKNWLFFDMLSDTMMDVGSVSIVGFIISFINLYKYGIPFQSTAIFIIAVGWVVDLIARLIVNHRAYDKIRERTNEQKR